MARGPGPKTYLDSCIFIDVIKRNADLWPGSLKLLLAVERGDIRLVASTLVLAEVACAGFDTQNAKTLAVVDKYLDRLQTRWAEVDVFTVRQARELAAKYGVAGADAVHLATAVRLEATYFISRDRKFPYGSTVEGCRVLHPGDSPLWDDTLDDTAVDLDARTNP